MSRPAGAPPSTRPAAPREAETGDPARLRAAESAENFPVALRVLPARHRRRLRAVYDVVRTVDDLGDDPRAAPADRTAALEEFRADLLASFAGARPRHPVLLALAPVAAECGLTAEPFDRLVEANLQDQRVHTYPTWDALLGYCALSAAPIGRLVLAVFEQPAGPRTLARSDAVCSALQLLEHWQDVAEDHARGRVYLPAEELAAFGVRLDPGTPLPQAGSSLRAAVRRLTGRALDLLRSGEPIVGEVHGWARLAVAGYVAGGLAAGDALYRVDGDVLGRAEEAARTRKRDVARHLAATLTRARRRSPPRARHTGPGTDEGRTG